jgi:hypothetical protein
VRPFAGQFISTTDAPARGDAAPVVIISHRFWLRQFGDDLHTRVSWSVRRRRGGL